jgi:2-isopropylmalate synthase
MEVEYGVVMPRRLQVEFSGEVQNYTDAHGGEMTAQDIWSLFDATYLDAASANLRYTAHHLFEETGQGGVPRQGIELHLSSEGHVVRLKGVGNGPIDAAVHALQSAGLEVQVRSFEERSTKASQQAGDAQACAFVELAEVGTRSERYGVGLDSNIITASLKALVSGVNRLGLQLAPLAAAVEEALV